MPITQNKKAFFDFEIEDRYECGLVLQGWEVKSIRAGKVQIKESHIQITNGELWLHYAHILPLETASTHEKALPTRPRKLLMHKQEIMRLIGKVERAGYTLIPLKMYFKDGRVKLEIGLGRGKRKYEKREDESKKEWKRTQERLLKTHTRKS